MSQFEKLLARIKTLDTNMRFDELRKVLESYGYTLNTAGGGGSHRTFRKPGHPPITIPQHTPIKRIYIVLVKELIERTEREENHDENA